MERHVNRRARSVDQRRVPGGDEEGTRVELLEGENLVDKDDFGLLNVFRLSNGSWQQVYRSVGKKGELIFTDRRMVIVFKEVPKNRSIFTVVALGQAVADSGKHRGESIVGHIMYPSISGVAARKRSVGVSDNTGMLRVLAVDATENPPASVMVEINKDKAPRIADTLVRAIVADRSRHASSSADDAARAKWAANAAGPFDPAPKTFETKDFGPSVPIR